MDEFLIPHANFKRLYEEYKKYGSLAIGIDFDNTIHDFHKKGYTYQSVIDLCIRAEKLGNTLHVYSSNPDHELIKSHCAEKGLKIVGINTDGVDLGCQSRKPFYSILLDDRAGLISAVEDLSALVNTIEAENYDKYVDNELQFSES